MARAGLILSLRSQGITDRAILSAFETVPHEAFVPDDYAEYAYRDASLPIACGQSISSPLILARMLLLLEPQGCTRILEIGTGTGYTAMLLSKLCKRVFTVERFAELAKAAEQRWAALSVSNIVGFHADGLQGLPRNAPFERILLTGSVEEIPAELEGQLAEDGILVAPVGAPNTRQILTRLVRTDADPIISEHGAVRLAPLIHGKSSLL